MNVPCFFFLGGGFALYLTFCGLPMMNLMKFVCWRDSDLGAQHDDFVGLETKTWQFCFKHGNFVFFVHKTWQFWYSVWYMLALFGLGGLCAQYCSSCSFWGIVRHQKYMDQKFLIDFSCLEKELTDIAEDTPLFNSSGGGKSLYWNWGLEVYFEFSSND